VAALQKTVTAQTATITKLKTDLTSAKAVIATFWAIWRRPSLTRAG
jgi:hypothetical protein